MIIIQNIKTQITNKSQIPITNGSKESMESLKFE
jgi:hypothetical protein